MNCGKFNPVIGGSKILNRTCLRSTYSLRRQLVLSYGFTAVITIGIAVVLAAIAAKNAGDAVNADMVHLFDERVVSGVGTAEIQIAKMYERKFNTMKGSALFLSEIVRDRIVKYPDEFQDDSFVPFVDHETGARGYPLVGPQLPLDFAIIPNLTPDNAKEHLQERADLMLSCADVISTLSSVFFYQGNCDPSETNPSAPGYLANCTAANNDPQNGGTIVSTPTLFGLADKANDIGLFLKPIFEAEQHAMQVAVYFFNSGAGALVAFPGFKMMSSSHYVSSGCEWMKEANPNTGRPFGTEEQILKCNPKGTNVSARLYNPMEREFCHDQVRNPGEVRIFGPYLDAIWGQWRLTIGQAVFDRITGEFIACTGHDLSVELVEQLVLSISESSRTSVILTRPDGTLVTSRGHRHFNTTATTHSVLDPGEPDSAVYERLMQDRFWDSGIWGIEQVQEYIASNFVKLDKKVISGVPIPLPPNHFDRNYEPEFYVFVETSLDGVQELVTSIDDFIHEGVVELSFNSSFIGLGGLAVFLVVIACVSHVLTRPLEWMESTAWKIVNHADRRVTDELVVSRNQHDSDPLVRWSPQTEIRELVSEFQTMIRGFSGTGSSRVAPAKTGELKNFVTWKDDFRQFYQLNQTMEERIKEEMSQKAQSYGRRLSMGKRSRNNSSYAPSASEIIANMSEASQVSEDEATFRSADISKQSGYQPKLFARTDSSTRFKRPLTRTNLGSNVSLHGSFRRNAEVEENVCIHRSKLFLWVLCSIVLPLVLTNIVIAVIVAGRLRDSFPTSVDKVDKYSFNLGLDFLCDHGRLHALQASQVLPGSLRDLHVLNRMTSWLLFDAIPRSDIFPSVEVAMAEECKQYTFDEVCPFDADPSRSLCDCAWNDPWGRACGKFGVRTRIYQKMWFVCQARDYDPITGARNRSRSFPEFDFNPSSTKWWSSVDEMPGSESGINASGHITTYDRLRVSAAIQTVTLPLYNYWNTDLISGGGRRTTLSTYVAFEADGGFLGYKGCNYEVSRASQFKSSEDNLAFEVNNKLCPVGKYGYDPRCRRWYKDTKEGAIWRDEFVHLTEPHEYAFREIGVSATSAVIDPVSREYVAATGIDLAPAELFSAFDDVDADFYFIITAGKEEDTIVGPGHPLNSAPARIADVVLPNDEDGSKNRENFANITAIMKAGEIGIRSFKRTSPETGTVEELYVSFAPLKARVLRATQADDYSRGAESAEILWYSIGLVKFASSLEARFQGIGDEIDANLNATVVTFLCIVGVVTLLSILVTALISLAVIKPIIMLLHVVQRVNAGRIEDDLPPLKGGSREVTQVYTSFAKLYKIVRMSNTSFFSGDLKWAHHIANNALQLFRKIGDKKAVAIACNNIGNTLLALSVQRADKPSGQDESDRLALSHALQYFDEAIEIGTKEFEVNEMDGKKAEFAQQLADRHFNRAMCLLHYANDSSSPSDAKDKAFVDLYRCREYDRGVQEYLLHEKLMFKFSDVVFDRLIRRIHGLSFLFRLEKSVWQVWDVNDLVEQADLMLQAAWDQNNAPLFRAVGRVGRLQELEAAVVCLEMTSGKLEEASQLAMRMLVEDEYILEPSFVIAAEAVLRLMKESNLTWSREAKLRTSLEFRRMRRAGKRASLEIERCFVFCIELSDKLDSGDLSMVQQELLAFYEEQCNGKDTVGLVAMNGTSDSNLVIRLAPKERIDQDQKEAMEKATNEMRGSMLNPTLPVAIDMVVSPSRSQTSDVFLIHISDGTVWDARAFTAMTKKVLEASSKRTAMINVVSIGINVEDEAYVEHCQNLCLATRSRNSSYIPASHDFIGEAFERAADSISSTLSCESKRIQLGITMERF